MNAEIPTARSGNAELHFSIFLEENRVRWAGLSKAELLLIGLAELS